MELIHEWAVDWVEDGACSLAARLIFFPFDVVDREHQGKQVQKGEDRVVIRQLTALRSISIREWSHACWLGYSKVAQTHRPHEERYTTEVGNNGRGGESDIAHLFHRFTGN